MELKTCKVQVENFRKEKDFMSEDLRDKKELITMLEGQKSKVEDELLERIE